MFTMLDVAIGLAFTYLLLSLLCTSINEWWATFWHMRGSVLRKAISRLVDPNSPESPEIANRILGQPEVRALSPRIDQPPSYIPKDVFVRAALKAGLVTPGSRPAAGGERQSNVSVAPDDEQAKKEWGELFDATMDRATGWYKRKLQVVSMCVAIGLTLCANADTVRIADRLWRSPTLREQFVAAAQQRVDEEKAKVVPAHYPDPDDPGLAEGTGDAESAETEWTPPESTPVSESERELLAGVLGWRQEYPAFNRKVCDVYMARREAVCGRPGGEAACEALLAKIDADPRVRVDGARLEPTDAWPGAALWQRQLFFTICARLFGWLLTIAAISVGAPFWFDTLNRFMNIRGSGKPPKKEEPPTQVVAAAAVTSQP